MLPLMQLVRQSAHVRRLALRLGTAAVGLGSLGCSTPPLVSSTRLFSHHQRTFASASLSEERLIGTDEEEGEPLTTTLEVFPPKHPKLASYQVLTEDGSIAEGAQVFAVRLDCLSPV